MDEILSRFHAAVLACEYETAFGLLWEAYYARVRGYLFAHGVAVADVDDLCQTVFAKLFTRLPAYSGGNLDAWVFTPAKFEVLRWRTERSRARWRVAALLGQEPAPAPGDAGDLQIEAELATTLERLREELGGAANQLIFDCLGEHMSDRDIVERVAVETGEALSEGAVRKRRLRIRAALTAGLAALGWLP
ncbi:MAG: RNA polymerase sigma factor [Myxococcota bacterium]